MADPVSAQHTGYGCQVFWDDNTSVGVVCRTPELDNFKQCTCWGCWGFENHNWDDNTKFDCTSPGTKSGTKWTGSGTYLRKCAQGFGDPGSAKGHCVIKPATLTDYGCQTFWHDGQSIGVVCRTPTVKNFMACYNFGCWGFENHNWDDNTVFYCTNPQGRTGDKWSPGYLGRCATLGQDDLHTGTCAINPCNPDAEVGCTNHECI
ncbi:hypothetical protein HDU97_004382 [Phlyctochytrium planicorne]|nr:hypothetical protein HDU97_004382 [Phlyctochytrium planicorne]